MPKFDIADIVAVFAQLQEEFTQHDCRWHILSAIGVECIILSVSSTFCLILEVYITVQV